MPHHIGRIVDPDVRDDGGLEPSVELGIAPNSGSLAEDSSAATEALKLDTTGGVTGPVAPAAQVATHNLPVETQSRHSEVPVEPVAAVEFRQSAQSALVGQLPPSPPSQGQLPPVQFPPGHSTSGRALDGDSERTKVADFEGLVEDDPQQRRSRDIELELVGDGLLSRPRGHTLPPPAKSPLSPRMVAVFAGFLGVLTVTTIIAIAMRLDHVKLPTEPVPSARPSAAPTVGTAPEIPPEPKRRQRNKVTGPYRIKDSANDPALRIVEGQVGFEPFLKAVEKAGVPLKEAYRLLVAFEKVRPLSSTSRHDKFVAAIDRASRRLKAFEYISGPEDVFQAKEREGGLLVAEKLDLQVKRERVTGAFAVGESGLERSVTDGGFEPQLLRSMREALIGHLSLEEIERGSRIRVIAQEVTALGEFARYSGIEALEIQFVSEKKRLRVYFFKGQKSRGYFDETARAPYEGGWRSPIPNAPVTSKFNMHRMHPVLHKVMPHTGVDFGAALGVPIGASSFGTITFLGWGGPTGNFIRLEHSGGVETGYAHMSRFAEGLKVGDKVKRLQTIGYVGSTGRSTGPHLHFTVKREGKFVDPMTLNLDALRVLPGDEREVFLQQKAQYDTQLDAIELPALPSGGAGPLPSAGPSSEGFEEEGPDTEASGSAAPAGSGAPVATEATGPAGSAAPSKNGSSLYLTDEELLRMQKSSESGEVEE